MKYNIREATIEDAKGKGYVHYTSWMETYSGLIKQEYLDTRSLDRCIVIAKRHPENTYILEVDNLIVGFACYNESRDEDLQNAGEVKAIYLLKEYYGQGFGRKLMDACLSKLTQYNQIGIWVLATNKRAIEFYEHLGFIADGLEKHVPVSEASALHEIRMILETK